MARAEVGSAKYIANKIKSKGLQRLKFYCQVCEKQCRDENGWKCHLQSPSHLRNASESKDFSRQFQQQFVYLLKASHGTKPINANKFYGEYIQDRDHVHMNATRWHSLGGFLKSLENKGIVNLSQDELGLVVAFKGKSVEESESAEEEEDKGLEEQMQRLKSEQSDQIEATEMSTETKSTDESANESTDDPQQPTLKRKADEPVAFALPKRRTNKKMTPL